MPVELDRARSRPLEPTKPLSHTRGRSWGAMPTPLSATTSSTRSAEPPAASLRPVNERRGASSAPTYLQALSTSWPTMKPHHLGSQ